MESSMPVQNLSLKSKYSVSFMSILCLQSIHLERLCFSEDFDVFSNSTLYISAKFTKTQSKHSVRPW